MDMLLPFPLAAEQKGCIKSLRPPKSGWFLSTASNSNRSTPACSPILRKRSRSPTPQDLQGDAMVEKGSDHSSDKSPSTPEQGVQRSCSSQSGRSGAKNSKVSPVVAYPFGVRRRTATLALLLPLPSSAVLSAAVS
ncbi:UNVERIFIED_CONTAM: hypothetical protein K2H54_015431 [Gekko kuhli]